MNSILEFNRVIAKHNNIKKTNNSNKTTANITNSNVSGNTPLVLTYCNDAEEIKIDKINRLYDKMYRLAFMEIDKGILLKPPRLKRSDNNCTDQPVNIFDVQILEHMISKLENNMTDMEKIDMYEIRLNKLEEHIIQKYEKSMYAEN